MTKKNNNNNANTEYLNKDKIKKNDNSAHKSNSQQPRGDKSGGGSGLDGKKLRPHELGGLESVRDGFRSDKLDGKGMGADKLGIDRLDVDGLAGELDKLNNIDNIDNTDNINNIDNIEEGYNASDKTIYNDNRNHNSNSDDSAVSVGSDQVNIGQSGVKHNSHNHAIADYLSVTDEAKTKLLENLRLKSNADIVPEGIIISTPKRGCNGREYKLDYAYYGINLTDSDEVVHLICKDENGEDVPLDLFVDLNSSLFLFGCIMNYEDNGVEFGFNFVNPNEKGKCGCGESFNV